MGRRRGRTGPGGAVVSSLSQNSGGAVVAKKGGKNRKDDDELNELAGLQSKKKGGKSNAGAGSSSGQAGSSSSAAASSSSSSSSWLGKSPQQMVRDWCVKNNRKRPSFYPVDGSEGIVRCVIHAGRKDGSKRSDPAYRSVSGVGDKPGEDYAALTLLHHLEHGKPIERLLAPEYRQTWLDLDKRQEDREEIQAKQAAVKVRKEFFKKRQETFDKNKVSATVHISTESRQAIEDALLEQTDTLSISNEAGPSTLGSAASGSKNNAVFRELLKRGFSEVDAQDASRRFANPADATDYLCLTLDESELPANFAPKSEVEVVQFYSGTTGKGPLLDPEVNKELVRLSCLSKLAVSRAMKRNDGDGCKTFASLYNTLTHGLINVDPSGNFEKDSLELAESEKQLEAESIEAIYGEDAKVGVGAVSFFPSKWAAVINLTELCPGIQHPSPIDVAFVDIDGAYPISPPLILISSSVNGDVADQHSLGAAERRLLMRATAGEVHSIRSNASSDIHSTSEPVSVIHGVISFLADASKEDLFKSASAGAQFANEADSLTTAEVAGRPSITPIKSEVKKASARRSNYERPPQRAARPKDSPQLVEMMKRRKSLPAYSARAEILKTVRASQVVVISGATGSGKTTQVPQFLLEDSVDRNEGISIVCTQPRRIAAMSVADRVADERCENVGETVGYHVKMNVKKSSNTCLLFCTTGVLLRRLQGNPSLKGLTHIVVDEVHERSVETDFLLLLLRKILPGRPSLKLVLMSATLDAHKFSTYFASKLRDSEVPVITIPGRTFPVTHFYLEDAVELSGYKLDPKSKYLKNGKGKKQHIGKYGLEPPPDAKFPVAQNSASAAAAEDNPLDDDDLEFYEYEEDMDIVLTKNGNQGNKASLGKQVDQGARQNKPIPSAPKIQDLSNITAKDTVALMDEEQVNVDLINLLVRRIDDDGRRTNDMGAILVFLPGVAEITVMIQKLQGTPNRRYLALPLHSLLSPEDQKKVFRRAPEGFRKVICATNIAETSITVEDVTVVIDTLRVKEMGYDALNGCSKLEEQFISRASAQQRAGRAGRVSAGKCYRLVRRHTFEKKLRAQTKPEIQRVALEHLILNIMTIIPKDVINGDPGKFLQQAVDPPEKDSIKVAIQNLLDIAAMEHEEQSERTEFTENATPVKLTGLGKHLSLLPVDAKIGKLLIFGALFQCLDAALTIAATISERSPFYSPFDKRDQVKEAKKSFAWGKSDLLMFVKVFNEWRNLVAKHGRGVRGPVGKFQEKNFLSNKTLWSIVDGRKQLADSLAETGLCGNISRQKKWEQDDQLNVHSGNERVIQAVICAGLYPNIVRLDMQQKYKKVHGGAVAVGGSAKDIKFRGKSMERVFLHPESINFDEGNYSTRWVAYFTKVLTSKLFLRDATMVSPYAILLFGGAIEVEHNKGQISVDKWIVFKSPARVGILARELRKQLDALLTNKFDDASMDIASNGRAVTQAIVKLLDTETYQL